MFPRIESVQSQEIINVSQDSFSDPILKNTPPRLTLSPAPANDDAEDRVEESLTDDHRVCNKVPEAHISGIHENLATGLPVASKHEGSSQRGETGKIGSRDSSLLGKGTGHSVTDKFPDCDTQALGAPLCSSAAQRIVVAQPKEDDDEDDLYGVTPERKTRTTPLRSQGVRTTSTHSSPAPPPLPASANPSELETSAPHLAYQEPASRSAFQQPDIVNEERPQRETPTPVEGAASHTAGMASGRKAALSSGKLTSGGSALAALRAKQQTVVARNATASAKIFEVAAEIRDPPPRALKAKETMKDSMTQPKASSKAGTSSKLASSKSKGSAIPRKPRRTGIVDRKRKAEPEVASVAGAGEAKSGPRERAKAGNPASPLKTGQSTGVASNDFQSDVFDMPQSSPKARPCETARCRAVKCAAPTAVFAINPASRKASKGMHTESPKADTGQREDGKRRLHLRNATYQLQVEKGQITKDEGDNHPLAVGLDQVREREVANSTEGPLEHSRLDASIEQSQPVGSQFNAIVLSDHSELSSSIKEDSPGPETRPVQLQIPVQSERPAASLRTPAAMRSSPPAAFQRAGSQSLRGTGLSRKAQIISFDKTGPRNQGSVPKSRYTLSSMPSMTVAVNWGSETHTSIDPVRQKASSVATSVKSGKSNQAAPPSNVAPDVHVALAGLFKSGPPAANDSNATALKVAVSAFIKKESTSVRNQDSMHYEEDDNDGGFTTLNDMGNFVNSPSPGQQLNAELKKTPTASQIVMPPPSLKARSPRQATKVVGESDSTAARPSMVASAAVHPKFMSIPPQTASIVAAEIPNETSTIPRSATTRKSNAKRSNPTETEPVRASKRTKAVSSEDVPSETHAAPTAEEFSSRRSDPSSTAVSAKADNEAPVAKRPATQVKTTSSSNLKGETLPPSATDAVTEQPVMQTMAGRSEKVLVEPLATSKQAHHQAKDFPLSVEDTAFKGDTQPGRVWHAQRKQNRHLSQNSQTVDINGSPVPHDMEVNESSTVLETFSQQADGSWGAIQHPSFGLKTPIDAADAVGEDSYSVLPSHQPPSLSSNTKTLPGPSGLKSKTMLHAKLTETESRKLLSKKMPLYVTLNPSGESQGVTIKHKAALLERTANFAHGIRRPSPPSDKRPRDTKDSVKTSAMELSPAQKIASETMNPNVPLEFGNRFASDLEKQVMALREHTAFTRAAEEDPDKTLVNECSQDTDVSKDLSSRSSPMSSGDSNMELLDEPEPDSESSGDEEDAADDLRKWRRCLQPHQLALYEDLVRVARVVTGYVTGMETAAENMIDDDYRRELILIEQEEEVQKKQYKQYVVNLQQSQNEKIREMKNLERVLRGVLDASDVAWEEHCKGRADKEQANRKVDELLASLSWAVNGG